MNKTEHCKECKGERAVEVYGDCEGNSCKVVCESCQGTGCHTSNCQISEFGLSMTKRLLASELATQVIPSKDIAPIISLLDNSCKPVNIPRGEAAIICSILNKFKTCDLISQETYNLIFERLNLPEKHKIVSYDTKKESKDFKTGCKRRIVARLDTMVTDGIIHDRSFEVYERAIMTCDGKSDIQEMCEYISGSVDDVKKLFFAAADNREFLNKNIPISQNINDNSHDKKGNHSI